MPDDHHSVTQRNWALVPISLYSLLFPFPLGVVDCTRGCSRRHEVAWESALRVTQILLGIEMLGWKGIAEAHRWLIETASDEEPEPEPFNVSLDAMRELVSGQHYMQFVKFSNLRKALLKRAEAISNEAATEVLGMPAAGARRISNSPPGTTRIDGASRAKEPDRPLPAVDRLIGYQKRGQLLYCTRNRIELWPRALTTTAAERRESTAVLVADIVTDWIPTTRTSTCYCWALEARYKHMQITAHTFDNDSVNKRADPDLRPTTTHILDVFAADDPRRQWKWNEQLREIQRLGPLVMTREYLDYASACASATYRAAIDNPASPS